MAKSSAKRQVLSLALGALLFTYGLLVAQPVAGGEAGPRFRPDGAQADALGRDEGYPPCRGLAYVREQRCRVGAFSHFDTLFPSRSINAPRARSHLRRASDEPAIRYSYGGQELSIDQYLEKYPVTGLLIAKNDSILVERYQYGRTDRNRFTSFSMAKTIVGLLVGIAIQEGAIRSIDDLAEIYVPELKGTEYGRTPVKALLQMASGVAFRETYTDTNSDIAKLAFATLGQERGGGLSAVKRFNKRYAAPGEAFSYSSAESVVLGLVLARAVGRTVSDYASEKLWKPLGAEADASWSIDATGQEITYANFTAVLRDWARLGLMLAHDGEWAGTRIVPRQWLLASTTSTPDSPSPGYGYHVWLIPGPGRSFALRGLRGQFVLVSSQAKLVLVQTAARAGSDPFADQELLSLWSALESQLR
jgi:CubicO group peptidase (beta-lactamase class C family)